MFWILGCFTLLLILILFLVFLRLSITFNYKYIKGAQLLMFTVAFYNIHLLRRGIDLHDSEKVDIWELVERQANQHHPISELFQKMQTMHYIVTAILKKSQIKHFKWDTEIGTGDASTTGIAVGGMWIIKGGLIGVLSEESKLICRPNLMIHPHFQKRGIQSEVECILSIRMGQTIYTFIKALKNSPLKKEVNT